MTHIQRPCNLNKTWTDWSKFWAAILVAISHYSTYVCITNHYSDSAFLRLWCQGGNLGVALFFFLSGYGLMESESKHHLGLKEFIKKRFFKVYLPVLLVSAFWIPICLFFSSHYHPVSLYVILYDVLWGGNDSVLWFVKILFALYGLFFIYSSIRLHGAFSLVILLMGSFLIMWIAIEAGYPYINIPLFSAGVMASHFKENNFLKIPFETLLLLFMSVIIGLVFLFVKDAHVAHGIINYIFVTIVIIIIRLVPPCETAIMVKVLEYIVPITYMLYLTHHKVLSFMVWKFGYVSLTTWIAVTIIVTIILTMLSKKLKI